MILKKRHHGFIYVCIAILASALLLPAKPEVDAALVKDLVWRNIGPANMGGRIADIQALDSNFRFVIVASASGGVWKSVNAGTTWTPIFDHYGTASIGSIAVFQKNPDIIWVGTGESNVRNSVGWGDGIYKSVDGGETFKNMGLRESNHIARIVLHPMDPDIAYAAAQGHLWGNTGKRGLFKTTDGGVTWEKLAGGLPEDGKTGCTDIQMDPNDPAVLYCAFWQRLRRPYRFDSGGPNGGIFKSGDGGRTWEKLTRGLPNGDIGRIGLAVYRKNPKIVMAIVEHGFHPTQRSKGYTDMEKKGSGIYRSDDGGETWGYVNRYNNRPFYYSHIYINPSDDQRVYAMGTNVQISLDGGKTFKSGMSGIAGDFHCMWIDPENKDRFYVCNDKGVSLTHDHGEHFNFFDNFCVSQVYEVSMDLRDPYFVYAGLQDNGIWGGPSNSRDYNGILNDHWFKFHSGDGFYTAVNPEDWTTVYSESQRGRLRRNHALFRQQSAIITPSARNTYNWKEKIPRGMDPKHPVVRMNWNTPFILSHHNPQTLYYGANYLFKSIDKGNHWTVISPDLSTNDPVMTNRESGGLTRDVTGAETHCTVVTLSESPLIPGLIWAGTDDGNIQLTRNDGQDWADVRGRVPGVPKGIWISRVEASHFTEGTCYAAFDGHRSDVFKPFVFKTEDFGKTWNDITGNLPESTCVYVIREDARNKNLLFAGTESGVFVSLSGGGRWIPLMNGLPVVAVRDLKIHPRNNDLVAGTHGRGVWILDDITPLQQFSEQTASADAVLFHNLPATQWEGISRGATRGHQYFAGRNPLSMSQVPASNSPTPLRNTATINYYLKAEASNPPRLRISNPAGDRTIDIPLKGDAGINRFRWNMQFSPPKARVMTFKKNMEKLLDHVLSHADKTGKKELEKLRVEFQAAEVPLELNRILSTVLENFRQLITERSFYLRPLQGPAAEPGAYRLELEVNGQILHGELIIREDPLKSRINK